MLFLDFLARRFGSARFGEVGGTGAFERVGWRGFLEGSGGFTGALGCVGPFRGGTG